MHPKASLFSEHAWQSCPCQTVRMEVAAPVKANSSHRHPESQNTDADWKPKLTVFSDGFLNVGIWSLLVCCYRKVCWRESVSSAEQRDKKYGDKTPGSLSCCFFQDAQASSVSLSLQLSERTCSFMVLCSAFALLWRIALDSVSKIC